MMVLWSSFPWQGGERLMSRCLLLFWGVGAMGGRRSSSAKLPKRCLSLQARTFLLTVSAGCRCTQYWEIDSESGLSCCFFFLSFRPKFVLPFLLLGGLDGWICELSGASTVLCIVYWISYYQLTASVPKSILSLIISFFSTKQNSRSLLWHCLCVCVCVWLDLLCLLLDFLLVNWIIDGECDSDGDGEFQTDLSPDGDSDLTDDDANDEKIDCPMRNPIHSQFNFQFIRPTDSTTVESGNALFMWGWVTS